VLDLFNASAQQGIMALLRAQDDCSLARKVNECKNGTRVWGAYPMDHVQMSEGKLSAAWVIIVAALQNKITAQYV